MLPLIYITPANIIQCLFIFLAILAVITLRPLRRFKGVVFFLIFFSIWMGFNLIEELQILPTNLLITPSFNLLLGPVIYYMVNNQVGAKVIDKARIIRHGFPAILSLCFTKHIELIIALGSISQLLYLVSSCKLLRRYDIAVVNSSSNAHALQLQWLGGINFFIFIFMLIDMIRLNIRTFISNEVYYFWYLADISILLFICCYLLIKSIRQTEVFDGLEEFEMQTEKPINYHNNKLTNSTENEKTEIMAIVFKDIDRQIREVELYKTPKLSINQVAEITGFSTKDTSLAINEGANKNFNDYINSLRIRAFKDIIKNQGRQKSSLLDIALECGFNSKSTFNLAFKKLEGITPSQYLNQL